MARSRSVPASPRPLSTYLPLIQSCRRYGINPQEYLTDVLHRLPLRQLEAQSTSAGSLRVGSRSRGEEIRTKSSRRATRPTMTEALLKLLAQILCLQLFPNAQEIGARNPLFGSVGAKMALGITMWWAGERGEALFSDNFTKGRVSPESLRPAGALVRPSICPNSASVRILSFQISHL